MRKILIPVVNLVVFILVGIAFGLGALPAIHQPADTAYSVGNFYEVIWSSQLPSNPSISFILLCVGMLGVIVSFISFKGRKFVAAISGLVLIGAGVMCLLVPQNYFAAFETTNGLSYSIGAGLIGMSVLSFIAGALSICVSALDFKK